jgi:signal transduction histidine kinase
MLSGPRGRHTERMRTRAVAFLAVAVTAVSMAMVAYVMARPDLVRPPGVHGDSLPPWSNLVLPAAWTASGVLLAWLRPRNRVGLLLLAVGACQAVSQAAGLYGMYGVGIADPQWPAARWVAFLGMPLWIPGLLPLVSILPAIYPTGRLPGPRWRLPVGAASVGIAVLTVAMLGGYNDSVPGPPPVSLDLPPAMRVPLGVAMAVGVIGGTGIILVMSVVRLTRARAPERQQLALLLLVAIPLLFLGALGPWHVVFVIAALAVPSAIAIGVLRYGMLGIEFVLRRGLVYVALTGAVLGIYLLLAAAAGSQLTGHPAAGVITAAVVAVGLTPLRDRLQIAVDRLVYGERGDPLRAVLRMGDDVATSSDPDELLPTVLATVMRAVRAPAAVVEATDGRLLATCGVPADGDALPLLVGGVDVGVLRVTRRTPNEQYAEQDRLLLTALAQQVAVVVRAQELAEALEAERDRVLSATGAERSRLRRDLHDGLGPSLSGLGLGLEAVQSALTHYDTHTATLVLQRLHAETGTAVTEVRRILDDLRPSALDDVGLISALRRQVDAASSEVPVMLELGDVAGLSSELETVVYRIVQEALTNAVRHAGAERITLRCDVSDGRIALEVADDGAGFAGPRVGGLGLGSMRHRANAVGGTLTITSGPAGTTVRADLPTSRAS